LFVWPLSIAFTHYFRQQRRQFSLRPGLARACAAIARQVKLVNGKPVLSLPASTRALLRADETDSVYFHVVTANGKLLAGDKELPTPDPSNRTT
jgi:two-component system sensor histidine kinase TctE